MIQFLLILFSQLIFFGVLKMNWSKTFINFLRSSLSGASINTEFYWNIFKRPLFCKSRDDASKLGRIIITICSTVLCTLCGFLGNLITQCENLTCSMDKRETCNGERPGYKPEMSWVSSLSRTSGSAQTALDGWVFEQLHRILKLCSEVRTIFRTVLSCKSIKKVLS